MVLNLCCCHLFKTVLRTMGVKEGCLTSHTDPCPWDPLRRLVERARAAGAMQGLEWMGMIAQDKIEKRRAELGHPIVNWKEILERWVTFGR